MTSSSASRFAFAIISRVRDTFEKRAELHRALHPSVDVDVYARVRVVARVRADPVALALRQRVSIRAPTLQLVANAPVEVILLPAIDPEGHEPHVKHVVHELRNRAVDPLHHD